jgi:aromatic-L-amino-acid/L-tryptophan decarboxylase
MAHRSHRHQRSRPAGPVSRLSVVCFGCRPTDWTNDTQAIDTLNRQAISAVQLGGRAFLAGTTINGVVALRACFVNAATSEADADALIAEVSTAMHRYREAPAQ